MGFSKKDFISIIDSMKAINFTNDLQRLSFKSLIINSKKDKLNHKAAQKNGKFINQYNLYFCS